MSWYIFLVRGFRFYGGELELEDDVETLELLSLDVLTELDDVLIELLELSDEEELETLDVDTELLDSLEVLTELDDEEEEELETLELDDDELLELVTASSCRARK